MTDLYPLKFKTIFKDKIWGGNKIKTVLHKDFSPLSNCGETWELSAVKGNISQVSNGPLAGEPLDQVIANEGENILGTQVISRFGKEFPLLIKFIDAREDLSVQVHPDDQMAERLHQGKGKTEMWYIMQADPGASLIVGFNRPLDRDIYLEYFNSGKLDEILNRVPVDKGDVFYIPAGRIHTIGKGILLAEVQQTSDITYRIYDFDRTDAEGNKRELHTKEAVEALDYTFYENYKTPYEQKDNARIPLVNAQYFTTNKFKVDKSHSFDYSEIDSFVIYIFTEGNGTLQWNGGEEKYKQGEVFLIPAVMKELEIIPADTSELLEVYIQ